MNELGEAAAWRETRLGKRVALAHGVFDVLHYGHIAHLEQAKAQADVLIVTITADEFVGKGPGRPYFTASHRAAVLSGLKSVDYVAVVREASAISALKAIQPDVFVRGEDYADPQRTTWDAAWAAEYSLAKSLGAQIVFTKGETHSSSAVLNATIERNGEHAEYLQGVKERYGIDGVLGMMEQAAQVTVVVSGEPILDEYVYVKPLGKSAKENTIAYQPLETDRFEGGSFIIADHMRAFCKATILETAYFPPITKRRYVEAAFKTKLFSTVNKPFIETYNPVELFRIATHGQQMGVIADYGHGMFSSPQVCDMIAESGPPFLAITVQSNSANWGFNLLTKWPRADYVVLDEMELRLASSDRIAEVGQLVQAQARRMRTSAFVVTRGHLGAIGWDGKTMFSCPAFSESVVDRMGAGDAFLAYTAPLAKIGAPMDVLLLVGNIAGAIKVGKIGNQAVTRKEVERWLNSLLK